jgi:hypothetical protein
MCKRFAKLTTNKLDSWNLTFNHLTISVLGKSISMLGKQILYRVTWFAACLICLQICKEALRLMNDKSQSIFDDLDSALHAWCTSDNMNSNVSSYHNGYKLNLTSWLEIHQISEMKILYSLVDILERIWSLIIIILIKWVTKS